MFELTCLVYGLLLPFHKAYFVFHLTTPPLMWIFMDPSLLYWTKFKIPVHPPILLSFVSPVDSDEIQLLLSGLRKVLTIFNSVCEELPTLRLRDIAGAIPNVAFGLTSF